ncbi:MAG: mtcA2 [Firmicutes bacterium]|nr:mtcA2 [Bacillota bacterium]
MLKKFSLFVVAMMLLGSTVSAHGSETGVTADDALKMLIAGNQRYYSGLHEIVDIGQGRRNELLKGQHPSAIIVSCSDSRVPPELIFDNGLGALFVIRTAGEVVDDEALGSVEYAIEHLGVKLVVVLGHEDCGAVKATIAGEKVPSHISAIAKAIAPAVDKAKTQQGDLVANAVNNNVDMIVSKLKASEPIIKEGIARDHVKVVGAVYHLETGKVVFR